MKKYITGFVLGVAITAGTVGVYATVQNYTLTSYTSSVYINDVKYPTDALPVLSLEANGGDNTYVPLRNFSEMLGANVSHDASSGRVDVTLDNNNTTTDSTNNNGNVSNNKGENNGNGDGNNKNKDKDKGNTTSGQGTVTGSETTTDTSTSASMETYKKYSATRLQDITKTFSSTYSLNIYGLDGTKYVESDEIEEKYFDDDYKLDNDEYEFVIYYNGSNLVGRLEEDDKLVLGDIPVVEVDDDDYLINYDYFVNNIYPIIK